MKPLSKGIWQTNGWHYIRQIFNRGHFLSLNEKVNDN